MVTRIAHLSDLHFGVEDETLVEDSLRVLQEEGVRALAVTGDITQKGRHREFAAAARYFERIDQPICLVPGNHDTPYWNLIARGFFPFKRYTDYMSNCTRSYVRLVEVDMTGVNSARGMQWRIDWSLGAINLDDVRFVSRQFTEQSGGKARFFLAHHPLVDREGVEIPGRTRRGNAAARLLHECQIDLILTGHTHVPNITPLPIGDGLTYRVNAGTAFSKRLRGTPASFHIIDVEPARFVVSQFDAIEGRFEPVNQTVLPRRELS